MNFEISYKQLNNFVDKEFVPLYDHFEGNELKQKLENSDDQLNYMYNTLQEVETVKAKSDFLHSYNFFLEVECEYDFADISSELTDMIRILRADIDILENKEGIKYWKENGLGKKTKIKISTPNQTKEEIHNKQILEVVLKTGERHLFQTNDTAVATAVHHLTGRKFSETQIRKDIIEKKNVGFKISIYQDAIKKLSDIISELNREKEKLFPNN